MRQFLLDFRRLRQQLVELTEEHQAGMLVLHWGGVNEEMPDEEGVVQ